MVALTPVPSLAEDEPPESSNADIEMTEAHFAAAHWVAAFLGSRTIDTSTPPSAEAKTCGLRDPIRLEAMAAV
jgi:hypothetical protein